MKRLKDVLKIKRRKNIDYSAKTGTKIPNKKFASFREDTKKNKKLQQEAKDPRQNIRTYDRVTSKNKSKFSRTWNGRLPPEDPSIQPQTLRKRVFDDP